MKLITGKTFDEERALYGAQELAATNCKFDGPADGESAFKEGRNTSVSRCFFNLRYPFWHDTNLKIENSELTPLCRAALWYSEQVEIRGTKLHGIKVLLRLHRADLEVVFTNGRVSGRIETWKRKYGSRTQAT